MATKATKATKRLCAPARISHARLVMVRKHQRAQLSAAKRNAPALFALAVRYGFAFEAEMGGDQFVREYHRGSGYGELISITVYANRNDSESEAQAWADAGRLYVVSVVHEMGQATKTFRKLSTMERYLKQLAKTHN